MSKQELQNEINSLLEGFEESAEAAKEDASKSGEEEAAASNEQGTEEEEGNEETSDRQEEGGQEGEKPAEEAGETGEDEITVLKNKIAELEGKLSGKEAREPGESSEAEETEAQLPELKPVSKEIDIFGEKKFDDIIEDESSFTEWAKGFAAKVQEATQESLYQNLPQVIQAYADQQINIKDQTKTFYSNNPDLAKHKKEVAKSANMIAQAEPNLGQEEFFDKVAKHARYMLGIDTKDEGKEEKSKGKEEANGKKSKPALNDKSAGSTSRSKTKQPELQGMEAEIADMLDKIE